MYTYLKSTQKDKFIYIKTHIFLGEHLCTLEGLTVNFRTDLSYFRDRRLWSVLSKKKSYVLGHHLSLIPSSQMVTIGGPYCRSNADTDLKRAAYNKTYWYLNGLVVREESSTTGLRFCWWVTSGSAGTLRVLCHHGVLTAALVPPANFCTACMFRQNVWRDHIRIKNHSFLLTNTGIHKMLKLK
jgi:hypothetical protein